MKNKITNTILRVLILSIFIILFGVLLSSILMIFSNQRENNANNSITDTPNVTNGFIVDLPEEFPLASPGDTLIIIDKIDNNYIIGFANKRNN